LNAPCERLRQSSGSAGRAQFVIDGEAVVLGVDGIADFNPIHSSRHDDVEHP
jgi:hypothetical protein